MGILHTLLWDWRLGIRTLRTTPALGGDAQPGDPASYEVLLAVAETLAADDVVFDVGCGRGRACAVFARACAKVVGIEASLVAAAAARRNGIAIIEADARAVDYAGATVLWMFNPFGPETMRAVLRRAAVARVLYYSGTEVHAQVFHAEGYALTRRQEFRADEHVVYHYAHSTTPWT